MIEKIILKANAGSFNFEKISNFLLQINYTIKDPIRSDQFLIFASQEESKRFLEDRKNNQIGDLPYVCLIGVTDEKIIINLKCEAEEMRLGKKFITWLLAEYECTAIDEEGNDITGNLSTLLSEIK